MTPLTLDDALEQLRLAYLSNDSERIEYAEATVDRLDVKPEPPTLHSAALWYASQGIPVFPLAPLSKQPLIPKAAGGNGLLDATVDTDQVTEWWGRNPQANIGLATGHLFDVIDIDGPEGVKSYVDLLDDLPTIYGKVNTPRPGGTHLYIAPDRDRTNKANLFPGIDFRARGGYVIGPPSMLDSRNDQHAGAYTWRTALDIDALKVACQA